jgi:hypothetical protein
MRSHSRIRLARGALSAGGFEYTNGSDLISISTALRDLGKLTNVEIALRKKDNSIAWVLQNLTLVSVDEASKVWIEGAMFDVTEQRTAFQRFEYQAYHDPLTALPNRSLFIDRLHVALAQSKRNKRPVRCFCSISTASTSSTMRSAVEWLTGCCAVGTSVATLREETRWRGSGRRIRVPGGRYGPRHGVGGR